MLLTSFIKRARLREKNKMGKCASYEVSKSRAKLRREALEYERRYFNTLEDAAGGINGIDKLSSKCRLQEATARYYY